jgi:hypothetical protein
MTSLAVKGSVEVHTSSEKLPADTNGTGKWVLADSQIECSELITVSGEPAVLRVRASWQYVGGSTPSGPLPPVRDAADLKPQGSLVSDRDRSVLLSGSEAKGTVDRNNQIRISDRQKEFSSR